LREIGSKQRVFQHPVKHIQLRITLEGIRGVRLFSDKEFNNETDRVHHDWYNLHTGQVGEEKAVYLIKTQNVLTRLFRQGVYGEIVPEGNFWI
jgi:hypothetical protein